MFGIGWGEVLVAGLVAILVLGPGKLPEAARAAGLIYSRLNRFMTEVRATLKTEIDLAGLDRPRPADPEPAPSPAESPNSRV